MEDMVARTPSEQNFDAPRWWTRLEWSPWEIALVPVRARDASSVASALTDEIARWLGMGSAEALRASSAAWAAEASVLARRGAAYRYLIYRSGRFAGTIELRPDAIRGH